MTASRALEQAGLTLDPATGLWVKPGSPAFGYSDGDAQERYIEQVVTQAEDLSSDSFELESRARDWASEYHLTRKRAQLLSGFAFERERRVLEIGCGCGAITRFLGETFREVVAIEGSPRRARIARQRTRDLPNVTIAAVPLAELQLEAAFDLVFVVGVLEYAAAFEPQAGDPYAAFLRRCRAFLKPAGVLVLAIENQFGLKYFAGLGEDHSGRPFDGIEGYASERSRAKTFGRHELEQRVSAEFACLSFYYPFPDYKLPQSIVSEAALGQFDVSGALGHPPSRDYIAPWRRPLFDDALAWQGLARNQLVHAFAPSFLVLAGPNPTTLPQLSGLAVMYSAGRRPEFQTITRAIATDTGVQTDKRRARGTGPFTRGPLTLRPLTEAWMEHPSLALELRRGRLRRGVSLATLFESCRPWFDWLRAQAGADANGMLSGAHLDATWSNTFIRAGRVELIDQEWIWNEPIRGRLLVIRAVYHFLYDRAELTRGVPELEQLSGARLIARIAALFDITLTPADFEEFVRIEAQILELVHCADAVAMRRLLRLKLNHPRVYVALRGIKRWSQLGLPRRLAARALRPLRGTPA